MITAGGVNGETPLLLIGLSMENATRLLGGQPISIKAADMERMGLPALDIVLVGGSSEEQMTADLRTIGWLDPDAVVHDKREPRA